MTVGTSRAIGGSTYACYGYDVVNRTITDNGSLAVTYAYDNTNKLTSRTLPNGITTAYDYDGLNRLTRLRHTTATATLTDNQYGYDSANRISQMTDVGGAHAYAYDSIDRLTSATYPGTTSESYTYDAVGNRTASHHSASYTYQPFNKVTNAGGVTYNYDNNGNLLTKVVGTDTTQYAWDFENRLKQVTLPNGTVVNYKYDALGRRIQRTTSAGADERYVYDGQNVVQDLNSSSSVVTSYLNGPGLDNHLRQTNATTGVSYFLTDHLGSTVGLTDSSANLVEQLTYDSFGNHTPSGRTRYTYTGRERDADTGLMYYRARFYDPQLGRFINEDPIGLNGGINQYAYVGNNPVGFIDPSGLCPQNPPEGQKAKFDFERFKHCIDIMYHVQLAPEDGHLRVFSTTRTGGHFIGVTEKNKYFRVDTSMTEYTSSDLRNLKGNTEPGIPAGGTMPGHPYLNFVASNFASNPRISLDVILMIQIHELGNSLAQITGYAPDAHNDELRRYDGDSGNALVECVYGGFVLPDGTITYYPGRN